MQDKMSEHAFIVLTSLLLTCFALVMHVPRPPAALVLYLNKPAWPKTPTHERARSQQTAQNNIHIDGRRAGNKCMKCKGWYLTCRARRTAKRPTNRRSSAHFLRRRRRQRSSKRSSISFLPFETDPLSNPLPPSRKYDEPASGGSRTSLGWGGGRRSARSGRYTGSLTRCRTGRRLRQDHRRCHQRLDHRFRGERREPVDAEGAAIGEWFCLASGSRTRARLRGLAAHSAFPCSLQYHISFTCGKRCTVYALQRLDIGRLPSDTAAWQLKAWVPAGASGASRLWEPASFGLSFYTPQFAGPSPLGAAGAWPFSALRSRDVTWLSGFAIL